MSADLAFLSGRELSAGLRAGRFSAAAATRAALDRIEAVNPAVNAYTLITFERAEREAALVDASLATGNDPGLLAGVTYSVKNLFDLEGEITLAGAKINRDDPPAARDATSVERLGKAGAICLGATNMGEYAYDFVTVNAHYGATRNPHALDRSAGGSSGGSGAAIAAGLGALSLGTDTNGSIRVPSSFCGIWGLKPTYGQLSRAGAFLFAGSLDTIGVFGREVGDLAHAYDAIVGPDRRDPVCRQGAREPSFAMLATGTENVRIATLGGYFATGWTDEIATAMALVSEALSVAQTIELPTPEIARAAAYSITAAEGGEFHRARLKARAADFDPNARDRFIAGSLAPTAWYLQAQRFRAHWQRAMAELFQSVDVLIAPATPLAAPTLDQTSFVHNGVELPLRPNIGLFTQPITLIGLPVVAAPVHLPGRLPLAIQLIGKPDSEALLLRIARMLEDCGVCAAPIAPLN